MSNVILFNLTTVLFGVASALYLGALYAKNEKISVAGTWVCMIAAVVSTAALGVRWYESYQMGIGRIPVTNLYESLVFFGWSVNLFSLIVDTGVEGVSDAAGTIRRFFVSIDLYRLLGATIRLRPGGRAMPPLPIVTMDAGSGVGSGSNKKGGLPRPLIMLSVVVLLLESLPSVTDHPHQPTPSNSIVEGSGACAIVTSSETSVTLTSSIAAESSRANGGWFPSYKLVNMTASAQVLDGPGWEVTVTV